MTSSPKNNDRHFYAEKGYKELQKKLKKLQPSKVFILTDANTYQYCLPGFLSNLKFGGALEIIEIDAGEESKNLDTCMGVWNSLSDLAADRKSLIINLGGGVVTDLGGFIAATFKRGIPFINIPTSLLAMVDASIGGKTGVDLGNLKNQIGVIKNPEIVLIDPIFLESLPAAEMRNGLAEIMKHGLIADEQYWNKVSELHKLNTTNLFEIIKESIAIKGKIVDEDPFEKSIRKTLNYGHTIGHAIESYFLSSSQKTNLAHGEAVAIGLIMESYLSRELLGFPNSKLDKITTVILGLFEKVSIHKNEVPEIIHLMKFDKKNEHGQINFVLLEDIGKAKINCKVPNDVLEKGFDYYSNY